MSGQGGLSSEEVELPLVGLSAESEVAAKKLQETDSIEDRSEITDDEEEEEEEEEEMTPSALLEPSTLPWPGDKGRTPQRNTDDGVSSEERDTGISGGSQDLSEEQSQAESDRKGRDKWRESMPEGERWRDDEVQRGDKGGGSLADDENEEEEEEDEAFWVPEKAALGFTPKVTIVNPSRREVPEESSHYEENEELQAEPDSATRVYSEWHEQDDKYYLCEELCSERLKVSLMMAAAAVVFPLVVWGGYALLPFDSPLVDGAPLRVMYTLRCAFFAIIPILLGMVVLGVARLRYSTLKPLHQSKLVNRGVAVHWHYVNESLALFLLFFLQLAVMATYISQDLVKLVPLLTIIFVFGRLIYWLCLSLDSSIRSFGFGLSFLPILAMLGTNLYYICVSAGQGAVFDVETPTAAPPQQRWWG